MSADGAMCVQKAQRGKKIMENLGIAEKNFLSREKIANLLFCLRDCEELENMKNIETINMR